MTSEVAPDSDFSAIEALISETERLSQGLCSTCARPLCAHQALVNIALGFKIEPRCFGCLSEALSQEKFILANRLKTYLNQRECHRAAWEWANEMEGIDGGVCLEADDEDFEEASESVPTEGPAIRSDAEWDAGEMGCGELVLELRLRLGSLQPGQIFKLCAQDPGAPQDLPAWCRLTGHTLLRAQHPTYWIKRKE